MSFGFAPKGWALCNGQLLRINQNQAPDSVSDTKCPLFAAFSRPFPPNHSTSIKRQRGGASRRSGGGKQVAKRRDETSLDPMEATGAKNVA